MQVTHRPVDRGMQVTNRPVDRGMQVTNRPVDRGMQVTHRPVDSGMYWFLIWTVQGKRLILATFGVISWLMVKIMSLMVIYQPQMHSPCYFGWRDGKITLKHLETKITWFSVPPLPVICRHLGGCHTVHAKGVPHSHVSDAFFSQCRLLSVTEGKCSNEGPVIQKA